MIRKTSAAAGFALALAFGTPAQADVDISINLGFGGFYGSNISCAQGRRVVEQRFSRVRTESCAGRNFDFTGRRNGKNYWVKVSRSTGRISEVRRIR